MRSSRAPPPFRVQRSAIHGTGVFATRRIRRGTRIVEYLGERVSHAEANRRYLGKDAHDNHTFLFTIDSRVVIDAAVGGNDARFINHCCDPNCETVMQDRRVFIEAVRDIEPGDELVYDYMIRHEAGDPPNIEQIFACHCGAATCRGTMLLKQEVPGKPEKKPGAARRRAPRAAAVVDSLTGARPGSR
ncbi:MAG TPA: SET domain-containing protein-lysine N-methyltransferase [Steroidobacteraceae bacterium]|nr:SET domain-containing protein-lysine N-methyltransferase [Steroidobacteraceae bacterium]